MVYAKSLRLSPGARLKFTQGEITNYASTDAAQIENAVDSFHHGWSGAVTVIVCLIGLFVLLGKAVFAGLGMMLIIFGLSYFFQRKSLLYNQELMKQRDKRVKLLSETLHVRPVSNG
jgi:ABC-type multidrug transport system fused ATPase/permease subunit